MHMGDALCMPAPNVKMQVTNFGSQFMSSISIACIGGFIIAFPYVFWELWCFIKPALTPNEIKKSRSSIFWVSFFFSLVFYLPISLWRHLRLAFFPIIN